MSSIFRRFPLDGPSLGLASLTLILGLLLISPSLGDMGGDSAQYLSLGRALAEGVGYRDTHLPTTPIHLHYPPGFPLLLAGVWLVFGGGSYIPFKILVLLCSALGLYGMGRALSARFGRRIGLGAVGMSLGLTPFLLQSVRIQSEGPYLLFLGLFLWFGTEEAGKEKGGQPCDARGIPWPALFVFALLGFSMRVGGMVLFLALGLSALRVWRQTRQRGPLVWGLAGALPVLGWFLVAETSGGGTWSYGREWAALQGGRISELLGSASFYFQAIGASIGGSPLVAASVFLTGGLTLLVLFGWGVAIRSQGWRLMDSVLLFSLLLALLAPMRSLRYLIPVFPLLSAYFLRGLSFLWSKAPLPRSSQEGQALTVSALALALFHFYASTDLYRDRWKDRDVLPNEAVILGLEKVRMNHWEEGLLLSGPRGSAVREAYGDFLLLLQALRRGKVLPRPTLLAARKPRLVAWMTGIPCLPLPAYKEGRNWVETLRSQGVSHVIEDGLFRQTQVLFRRLRREKGDPGLTTVLRIRRAALHGLALPPASPKGG